MVLPDSFVLSPDTGRKTDNCALMAEAYQRSLAAPNGRFRTLSHLLESIGQRLRHGGGRQRRGVGPRADHDVVVMCGRGRRVRCDRGQRRSGGRRRGRFRSHLRATASAQRVRWGVNTQLDLVPSRHMRCSGSPAGSNTLVEPCGLRRPHVNWGFREPHMSALAVDWWAPFTVIHDAVSTPAGTARDVTCTHAPSVPSQLLGTVYGRTQSPTCARTTDARPVPMAPLSSTEVDRLVGSAPTAQETGPLSRLRDPRDVRLL